MLSRVVKRGLFVCAGVALPVFVFANGNEKGHEHGAEQASDSLREIAETLEKMSVQAVIIASIVITVLVLFSLLKKNKSELLKQWIFGVITALTIAATLLIAGSTVYINLNSVTKGPVHWHADFQIYDCGEPIDLIDPEGLLNRVGTPVLHEHGDARIHVEGTVLGLPDVSLSSFFSVVGGDLQPGEFSIPTNEGARVLRDGDSCPDGRAGQLQVFVFQTHDGAVTQTKLDNYPDYILSPEGVVPPGDCVIFEFTPELKQRTEHLCDFYQIDINNGDLRYEL